MTGSDSLLKAAELLKENFALDTTLGEMLKDLRGRGVTLPDSIVQAALPGIPEVDGSKRNIRSERSETARAAARRSQHRETIDLFVRLWRDLRGGEYRVAGAKDGQAVKVLLRFPEATPQEIERRMRIAFADPWFKQNGNLSTFVSRWSNLDRVGQTRPGDPVRLQSSAQGKRVVGYDETTGQLVYG
jgi:hypothetical protein